MSDRERFEAFVAAISAMETIAQDIYRTSAEKRDGWRSALIGLRRQMGAGVTNVAASLDGWTPADPQAAAMLGRLRTEMATLRAAIANHQARWPAVTMDTSAPEYKESLGTLLAAQMAVRHTSETLSALFERG